MELIIRKKRIQIGNSINFSKRVDTYDYYNQKWCPSQLSKLLGYLSDDLFEYTFNKSKKTNSRAFSISCIHCHRLILVIRFNYQLLKINVKFDHICYHMPVIKLDNNMEYNYTLSLKNHGYPKIFKSIGKIICKKNRDNLELNSLFYENSYSNFSKRLMNRIKTCGSSLEEFIDLLSERGDIYVRLTNNNPFLDYSFSPNTQFNGCYLNSLCFVAPWARSIIEWGKIIELDTSFKATYPYCYHIPVIIKHNVSIPLGFILNVKENEDIYQIMFDCLKKSCGEAHCENFVVLSDGHKAIETFCEKNDFQQFLCYRHFIESFGSNSYIGRVVSHLLYCISEESFQQELSYSISEIQEYLSRYPIEEIHLQRFGSYTGYKIGKNSIQPKNPEILKKLAMWMRSGIPTCTNHVESYHSKINQKLKCNTNFVTGILTILEYINNKFEKTKESVNKGIKLELRTIEKMSNTDDDIHECDCDYSKRLELKYGLKMPCYHVYRHWEKHNMLPLQLSFPKISNKEVFTKNIELISSSDPIVASKKKKMKCFSIIREINDFDKYSRSGKNFMKAVYDVSLKNRIGFQEAEIFCSSILLNDL